MTTRTASQKSGKAVYFIQNGLWITHDTCSPGMAKQYLLPSDTNPECRDQYTDNFKPEIYGGIVRRDSDGNVIIRR